MDIKKFMGKVRVSHGCWEWAGKRNSDGYGRFTRGGRSIMAHRHSWALHHGEIPKGLLVCHKCDNPCCVNPDHLFLGTHADNVRDMIGKKRNADFSINLSRPFLSGEKNRKAKLTQKEISEIRELYGVGNHSHRKIAEMYGVFHTQIGRIVRKENWK